MHVSIQLVVLYTVTEKNTEGNDALEYWDTYVCFQRSSILSNPPNFFLVIGSLYWGGGGGGLAFSFSSCQQKVFKKGITPSSVTTPPPSPSLSIYFCRSGHMHGAPTVPPPSQSGSQSTIMNAIGRIFPRSRTRSNVKKESVFAD